MLRSLSRLALIAATLAPGVALAHTGVGDTGGFVHGFAHPIGGLDHVLAMVLVGVFAWQLGGRALWLVPSAFVAVMALGGVLGFAGVAVPFVEVGIALSVVVLGAVVAFGFKAPVAVAMGLAGLFAVFHGHAHGAEMPETVAGAAYGLGFMLGTALLHLVGIGMGYAVGSLGDRYGQVVTRAAGGVAALAGVAILTGIL
ncbi:MAG TPA: HupE/UreJ family protein [Geminicoccaceae bacterium]|nr:HupE/UreJ family protein [Geminicoccus sp.]HMU51065.1 HupE/UreJ family protein [Geminicoccaceae bacterium]